MNNNTFKGCSNSLAIIARVVADPELSAFADTLSQSWREEVERSVNAERERCAKIAESHVINEDGKPCLDPNSGVFDRNTSLVAAACNIRSGE